MLLPPIVLIAVVAISVAGRIASPAPQRAAIAEASQPAMDAVVTPPIARADSPTFRSDWPAAVAAQNAAGPRQREEGTDGLMGRLSFGLPSDTPFPPFARLAPVNRFTIDDARTAWSGFDSTPPWVRRVGGLSGYVVDPYDR